jgi:peptidoglycan-associated lipoprotein
MRSTIKLMLVLSVAALTAGAAGCAKKLPAPPPPPPVQQPTPTPAPPAPAPVETPHTDTAPSGDVATVLKSLKTVFFSLDSYTLDDATRATLDANAKILRDNANVSIRIEGHCDERGTVEYNMGLGENRAKAVKDYLVAAGVSESRLSTISYGKERPLVESHEEAAWSKNRRAEFSKP